MTDEITARPGQPDDVDDNDNDENEELEKEITENLKKARNHFSDWRKRAREDYDFFAGIQWSEKDKEKLEKEKRPVVTFNRIARTINSVIGLELQNRQEVTYLPRQLQDSTFNEMLTDAAKWARENCDAEDEESEAFQDCVITGMGFTETRMDYEVNQDGDIKQDRIDPLEMLVDPSAKKRNMNDARWIAREIDFEKKDFEETFPNAAEDYNITFDDDDDNNGNSPHVVDHSRSYKNDENSNRTDGDVKKIRVIQYQYFEREPYYRVSVENKMIELSPVKYKTLAENGILDNTPAIKQVRRVFYQCFLVGGKIIEKVALDCAEFTFNVITGLRDANNNVWFGLVAMMKDPQRWANKWLSQIQHIVNTGAKNGIIAERGAISNPSKFEENFSKPGSISYVEDGAISQGRLQMKEPPPYPQGVDRLLEFAIQGINDVPGINLELIGMANRDQAIGLEDTRKQAGVTILATFFDSLRRYRKQQGRLLAYFIREYISDGRLIKVIGNEGVQYLPLFRDKVAFQYDVIVDDAPTSTNMKEKVYKTVTAMLPMLLQSGIPIPPELLDYAPLPSSLVQSWKKLIEDSKSNPVRDQMQQIKLMQEQLDTQQRQADIDKTASETQANYAKAEQSHATGQNETALAMQKTSESNSEQANKYQEMMMTQKRKDIEVYLNHQRKVLEANMQREINANKY